MSITRHDPNTIFLGGDRVVINDLAAGVAIKPGHLIERYNTAGVWRLRPHTTAGANTTKLIATEQSMLNKGVNDPYAVNDLVEAIVAQGGTNLWMRINSGVAVAFGDKLESAGDGSVRVGAGGWLFSALETKTATGDNVFVRVEAL